MRPPVFIAIFSGVIIISIAAIFIHQLQPPALTDDRQTPQLRNHTTTQLLDISKKMSFTEIVKLLKEQGLIRSEKAFKSYCLITGKAHRFQPGRYLIERGFSAPELARILVSGPPEISVMFFPGITLKEADERLSDLSIIKPGELINFDISSLKNDYPWLFENNSSSFGKHSGGQLEGFLLPDTYYFLPATGPDLTIRKILDNFELNALSFLQKIRQNENDDFFNVLILASLLEKEMPDNSDRRIAAGILKKRLSAGMALQVDATVIYAKCEGRFLKCPSLAKEDFKMDSPYNTYLYSGLPPTPISNPSLDAIKAAAEPIQTDYWYYLSDPKTKKTIFSKTLEEHNINRAKYLNK